MLRNSKQVLCHICRKIILNEVLSLNAQESFRGQYIRLFMRFLNEVLSLNAQESHTRQTRHKITLLNEVLSLNAQEYLTVT